MPIRTESIELDISSCCACAGPVCARQGDEGMALNVTVLDSGEAVDLTGLTATLEYNNPALVQVTGTVSGGVASFELPSAALSGAGTWHPYVRLSQGDSDVASTGSFVLRVARAADLSAQQAEGYVPQLDQALSTATAASEAAQQAATQAAQAVEDAQQAVTDAQGAVSAANSAAASANAAADAASDAAQAARGNVLAGSETGRVVSVDDAYAAKPREVRVEGRTVNNLWPVINGMANGITVATDGTGLVTVTGTATDDADIVADVSGWATGKSYTATISVNPTGCSAYFEVQKPSGNTSINASTTGATLNVASDATKCVAGVHVVSSNTVNASFRVMLVEGTEAPDCFVAPGLHSVDELAVVEAGRNLWVNPSGTSAGVTAKGNGDGSVTVSGTSDGACDIYEPLVGLRENTTYTISTDRKVTGADRNGVGFYAFDGVTTYYAQSGGGTQRTFSTGDDVSSWRAGFFIPSNIPSTVSGTYRVMLNEGSEALPWAPPQPVATTPVGLDGRELRSLPDGTCDELVIGADGTCEIIQRVQMVDGELSAFDEPQTITLDAVTLPALPSPDATVWADTGAIPTDVGLAYERDISIAFAKLEAEVAALKVNQATS